MSFEIKDNKVIIYEPLVDIESIFDLVKNLKEIKATKIIIDMVNNYSLPSAIIGQLTALRDRGKEIEIIIYNELIFSLFRDLGLDKLFTLKKVDK